MVRGKQTRRQLLAGCTSAGVAILAGCSASGSEDTTTDNGPETTVAPTEVSVAFAGDGEIEMGAVESEDPETVELSVVTGDGEPVTVDNLTLTISSGTADLDSEIVRQVTGESLAVTFDGDEGVSLPDGKSEGTLQVGVVTPPNGNLVDRDANATITVVA